jgi:S-adenosylmethionine:tRNA ribosyltransferase-isomerase
MRTECLDYDLPGELIAQVPARMRGGSRLLAMNRATGVVSDRRFMDILEYLRPWDCLVLNNTKVLPARFFARRPTGAKLEGLFLGESPDGLWEVMVKGAGKVKAAEQIVLRDKTGNDWGLARAVERTDDGNWLLDVGSGESTEKILDKIGVAPLPPYIKRGEDDRSASEDLQRYQTVYALSPGAVAAPTAGLHFTKEMLDRLTDNGVRLAYVTLHVGAGTFKPVKAVELADHKIHTEMFSISQDSADLINQAKDKGGRIIAVGTTSVRTLETICSRGKVAAAEGSTDLFITPGYKFRIVGAMITNFHLPRSTLLALVCAFAGLENVLAAYRHAIQERYRFYSYGDAMLII